MPSTLSPSAPIATPAALELPVTPRILVIRPGGLAELITLTPALHSLRRLHPAGSITVLTSPRAAQAHALMADASHVIGHRSIWDSRPGSRLPDVGAEEDLVTLLRSGVFDASFVFTTSGSSPYPAAYACYLSGIPVRVAQSSERAGGVLSHAIEEARLPTHDVERNLRLLRGLRLPTGGTRPSVVIPDGAAAEARRVLRAAGLRPDEPFICVAPGSQDSLERFDCELLGQGAGALAATVQLPALVVGSRRESECGKRVVAAAGAGRVRSVAGQTSAGGLAALIDMSRVLISATPAPVQIADALGTPVAAVLRDCDAALVPQHAPFALLTPEQGPAITPNVMAEAGLRLVTATANRMRRSA